MESKLRTTLRRIAFPSESSSVAEVPSVATPNRSQRRIGVRADTEKGGVRGETEPPTGVGDAEPRAHKPLNRRRRWSQGPAGERVHRDAVVEDKHGEADGGDVEDEDDEALRRVGEVDEGGGAVRREESAG